MGTLDSREFTWRVNTSPNYSTRHSFSSLGFPHANTGGNVGRCVGEHRFFHEDTVQINWPCVSIADGYLSVLRFLGRPFLAELQGSAIN